MLPLLKAVKYLKFFEKSSLSGAKNALIFRCHLVTILDLSNVNVTYRVRIFVVFCEESINSNKILLKLRFNFDIIGLEVCRSGIVECIGKSQIMRMLFYSKRIHPNSVKPCQPVCCAPPLVEEIEASASNILMWSAGN